MQLLQEEKLAQRDEIRNLRGTTFCQIVIFPQNAIEWSWKRSRESLQLLEHIESIASRLSEQGIDLETERKIEQVCLFIPANCASFARIFIDVP